MHIVERQAGDLGLLRRLAARQVRAERQDRYPVAFHAVRGVPTADIEQALARSRGFVQRWAYAYRNGRIRALPARFDAGPTQTDGVCTLRGKDIQRILRAEFGVQLSLNSVHRTLSRLGYSCLAPRPRHEHQDPQAKAHFRELTPHSPENERVGAGVRATPPRLLHG